MDASHPESDRDAVKTAFPGDTWERGGGFISVPEQGGDKLIPDSPLNPGVLHTVATGGSGHLGLYPTQKGPSLAL